MRIAGNRSAADAQTLARTGSLDVKRTRPQLDMLEALQIRCARVAVGPSTVRGQGGPGLVKAAREHLCSLPLSQFGTSRPTLMRARLDRATIDLMEALPRRGRSWGVARKVLNIFLRDAVYTVYLRDAFRLERGERLLELPLDSITARRFQRDVGGRQLPRWRGVKRLAPDMSDEYQAAAHAIAVARGIARVHLDAYWWAVRDRKGAG